MLLLFLILNEKPAFLPLSLLVGVPTLVSGGGVAFQNGIPTAAFDEVSWGLGDSSSH